MSVSIILFGESWLPAGGWTVGNLDEAEGGMHIFAEEIGHRVGHAAIGG